VRADAPGVRLVAVTGYGQPDDLARARAAGFDVHIVKPVDPQQIRDALVAEG
jgi:CheY-like chemotaxis protein